MATKLLLCISADQATAAVWRRRLVTCARFDNNQDGWNALSNFLRGAGGTPIHVVVDSVDEDYRFETLPHATGRDRVEMVSRKLRQLYRGTTYYSYSLQERGTGKRKDDRYLFAALTSPDILAPWLRTIELNGVPVAGVYSLPMVSASLIERLKLKDANLLVISKNNAGVRQTFFKDLKFRISRLTPLREEDEVADQYYADEVGNTRMYLDALNVTHVDDALKVLILDQDDSLAGLPAAISRGRPNMQCQRMERVEIQTRLGVSPGSMDASADALHLHLLGEHTPPLNLAPAATTGRYRGYLAKRIVYAASAATVLGSLAWSGASAFETMRLEGEISRAKEQTQQFQARYQQVTAQFPQAPTTSADLRNTVEAAEQIRSAQRTPEPVLIYISQVLDATPQVRLGRIEWYYGKLPQAMDAAIRGKADAGAVAPPPGLPAQVAVIQADVSQQSADYRAMLSIIGEFSQRLSQSPAVAEVRALQLPLDVSSTAGLSGSTSAGSALGTQFQLAILFKPGA